MRQPGMHEVADGVLIVRASAAAAARAAILGDGRQPTPDGIQLLMQCPVPRAVGETGHTLTFADCTLHVLPVGSPPEDGAPTRRGVVMLTVAEARLSLRFAELRPLMFQSVPVDAALRSVFAGAIAHVLATGHVLDPHGLAHHLLGLAELVLRSALRAQLERVDALAARRRAALEFIRGNLSDPELGAEQVADALFISRRSLYQLFDDGQGVSERIRGLRIERARGLLSDPAKAAQPVAEIARDCGFVNAAHFARTFRKWVGRTPREYRDDALG